MNQLDRDARASVLGMMAEGMSMQSITRLTGISKNTVAKLLKDAGEAFRVYHDAKVRNVTAKLVQCDAMWSFCAMEHVPSARRGASAAGDVYTWTGIDADSKLILSYFVGRRDVGAKVFIADLADRLSGRMQVNTDGHRAYLQAVDDASRADLDHAVLMKLYGATEASRNTRESGPDEPLGAVDRVVRRDPDDVRMFTSVERQHPNLRIDMPSTTRVANVLRKKIESHQYALAIYFMHYNFVRIHRTSRVTPAMAAGVSDKLWSLEDLVTLIEAAQPPPKKRGPGKARRSDRTSGAGL